MAPVQPSHRTSLPKKSILKTTTHSTTNTTPRPATSIFSTSKKDRRHIKHAALLSKISKQNTKLKRRRPSKKLVATLDSLADALPDDDELPLKKRGAAGMRPEDQVNVIKRRSLKSKPGALKRRQRLDNEERRRWGRNMAQMASTVPVNGNGGATGAERGMLEQSGSGSGRWAALRGFIGETLERREDGVKTKT